MIGLDALLEVGGKLIDKLIPDPQAKAKAQLDACDEVGEDAWQGDGPHAAKSAGPHGSQHPKRLFAHGVQSGRDVVDDLEAGREKHHADGGAVIDTKDQQQHWRPGEGGNGQHGADQRLKNQATPPCHSHQQADESPKHHGQYHAYQDAIQALACMGPQHIGMWALGAGLLPQRRRNDARGRDEGGIDPIGRTAGFPGQQNQPHTDEGAQPCGMTPPSPPGHAWAHRVRAPL